jgi:hypothetical protein
MVLIRGSARKLGVGRRGADETIVWRLRVVARPRPEDEGSVAVTTIARAGAAPVAFSRKPRNDHRLDALHLVQPSG